MAFLSALCSTGAKYAYKGIYAAGTAALYGFGVYYEHEDTTLVRRVSSAFANCQEGVASCCVPNWQNVVATAHEVPMMSAVNTAVLPLLGFGLGLAAANTFVKNNRQPAGCCKAAIGIFSCATLVAYPLSIFYEYTDSSLVTKIGAAFAGCVAKNVTECCVEGWERVFDVGYTHIPMMSLVCTIAMPVLGFAAGALIYKPLVHACNQKSKWDYKPIQVVGEQNPYEDNEI